MDDETAHNHREAVKQQWNESASFWNNTLSNELGSDLTWRGSRFQFSTYLPQPDPTVSILDAGCGVGQTSCLLASFGYNVKACDLSPKMLDFARERAANLKLAHPPAFTEASIDNLPYPASEFEVVLCLGVLDFTPRPAYALKELRRVTKPGGKLLLATHGANSPIRKQYWQRFLHGLDPHADKASSILNGIAPWEIEKLLPVLGWQLVHQEGHFDTSVSGEANEFEPEFMRRQPIVFQQTVATVWIIVAEAVEPQPLL